MSHLCRRCKIEGRRRLTRGDVRHLHELEEGEAFVLAGSRRESRLIEKRPGRCSILDPTPAEEVAFETFDGREVSFERNGSDRRDVSPTTLVEPVDGRPA